LRQDSKFKVGEKRNAINLGQQKQSTK
jgi:hypothetical protein